MDIAYTVGRFQPPTIGHKSLIEEVMKLGKAYVFVSSSKPDKLKNPLSIDQKMPILEHMFENEIRDGKLVIVNTAEDCGNCGGPGRALNWLRTKEPGKITLVVGDHPEFALGQPIWGSPPSQPDQVKMLEAGTARTKTIDEPGDLESYNMSGTKSRLLVAMGRKADFYKSVGYEGQINVPEVEKVYKTIKAWVAKMPAKKGGNKPLEDVSSADMEYDIRDYLPRDRTRRRRKTNSRTLRKYSKPQNVYSHKYSS